ncbi:NAD-dependent epimerase/dehydratase family protein [Catellatospora tritici]|uniref:NAD-dependent epimerase/dehydratase family protein n=1 Tax=Catellatospora tritici TaxID=2851566 RepID=UPI001C2DCEDA|nr:NAD(P)-dependent oxidoreductase [Catellatospora tritici]MBV1853604.1 NAD(P)-dependent oxidoreductase [Catellatospora tritici]
MGRILITGGAGKVATLLRTGMRREGRVLRLLDIRPPAPLPDGDGAEEVVIGSLTDPEVLAAALRDVDAVVHLGGQSRESDVRDVLESNMFGTYQLFEAARAAGVNRLVLASSNHAAGFQDRTQVGPDGLLPSDLPGRPDTLYGWSKVAMESCGQLYADRFGMDVVCLRIGLWFPKPPGLRGLAMWLSPADGVRLVEACLSAPSPGFRIVWGISRNTRRWWSLAEGEALGYHPVDDAEVFADELIAQHGEPDFDKDPLLTRVGGQWCDVPLGVAY